MSSQYKNLSSISAQNAPDPATQKSFAERINRLAWDEAYREDARRKACFAQARRRAKEKPVSLPKLAWMEREA